jgi:hypothetical protein
MTIYVIIRMKDAEQQFVSVFITRMDAEQFVLQYDDGTLMIQPIPNGLMYKPQKPIEFAIPFKPSESDKPTKSPEPDRH